MRQHGWQGVRRQKSVRTTVADPTAERAPELVDRQFRVPTPNALVVADFTYVKLVIGAYGGTLIGWEAASVKQTRFVGSAIRQGRCAARPAWPPDRRRHPPLRCRARESDGLGPGSFQTYPQAKRHCDEIAREPCQASGICEAVLLGRRARLATRSRPSPSFSQGKIQAAAPRPIMRGAREEFQPATAAALNRSAGASGRKVHVVLGFQRWSQRLLSKYRI
jgi:hypothetical protein